jgi:hypothetical protein
MSITARTQSRDRFVTCAIWPLAVMITSPSTERTRVIRKLTSSTVPITGSAIPGTQMRMRSPKPYWALGDQEEPGKQILDDALRPEAQRDAGDGARCDETGER